VKDIDLLVVGAGIVGLASAWRLQGAHPAARVRVIDKEDRLAAHQSGRNSGVLHSGLYYRPGSRKARNCRRGREQMIRYCEERRIPLRICGKLVLATRAEELPRLAELAERGRRNGVECRELEPEAFREWEPEARGLRALHVPEAGVVDYRAVCEALAREIRERGGEIRLGVRLRSARPERGGVRVQTTGGDFHARMLINCAGLHADRVAQAAGIRAAARTTPFRGEYRRLRPPADRLVRALLYPVPDPTFPFLGVHFTRGIDGEVHCGPNAVPAFAREGYRWSKVDLRDLAQMAVWPGTWRLLARAWRTAAGEIHRSWSRAAFVAAAQRMLPALCVRDLEPAPAGVRAQPLDRNGGLVDDFLYAESPHALHVLCAPSPAATAALAIGAEISERAAARLED